MPRILVVGADSFIAGHFIKSCQQRHELILISRIPLNDRNVIVHEDLFSLEMDYFQNIDTVINFAAIVHRPNIKDEGLYRRVNYELPLFLANMAYTAGVKYFIQMSTIAVYGESERINKNTQYAPFNDYGKYKLKTDLDLVKIYNDTQLNIIVVRPSMVYGGGNAPGNLHRLIKLTKTGYWLPFKGINNKKQFCNINLLVDTLYYLIEHKSKGIFLVADKELTSTSTLISLINKARNVRDKQFSFLLFWRILKMVHPRLSKKLIGDLIIEDNFASEIINTSSDYDIESGIKEMI